jgi:NAD(P)-dependent dehydrogenase (short-subunit alcohol dehydrogenase family)
VSASFTRDQRIVITGAAQGIGRAIACVLAARGASLILWDKHVEGVRETAALLDKNACVQWASVDVTKPEHINAAAQKACADGPIYGLVNNAGIYPRAPILDASYDMWHEVWATNVMGMVMTTKAFAPDMLARQRGVIVNMASGRALQGTVRGAHYAASKAAIISFTKSAALEFAPHLRVNAVIPGVTETAQPLAEVSREALHARGSKIPLGRIGQPADIAKPVAFLLSDDAAYMTGQAVVVNGGAIMVP